MNGLHLDIKWSMYRPEYFEAILSQAADLGIDTILLEFENKLFFDWLKPALHPEHWTKGELKAFLASAKKKHLTVIPSVPLFGHLEWILQWPQWSYLRENNDFHEICPSHPATPEFVGRLLEETIRLFPHAPMIHLGGDETWSLGTCPVCQASAKSKGQLYLDHYLPLIEQVERSGKRPMLYADMLLTHPEMVSEIPRSVIICDWDYWSGNPEIRIWGSPVQVKPNESWNKVPEPYRRIKKYFIDSRGKNVEFPYVSYLQEKGFDVVTLPAARSCGDNYCAPRTQWHVRNAMAASRRARSCNSLGTIITSWQVRFNPLETNWSAIAASAWSYQNPEMTYEKLSDRFAQEFFGCSWPTIFNDLDLLAVDLPGLRGGHHNPCPPNFIPPYLHYLYSDTNSAMYQDLKKRLPQIQKCFRQGLSCLHRYQSKIIRHRDCFDHWLLAAETLVHKAQFESVLMNLVSGPQRTSSHLARLEKEMHSLEDRHRRLFKKSIMPFSTEMEVNLRFGEALAIVQGKPFPLLVSQG